jgi:hypothetical protein
MFTYSSPPRLRTSAAVETSGRSFDKVLSESKNVVDETKKRPHNLVSLLLMQRRRTKRYRVVVVLKLDASSAVRFR